MSLHNNEYEIEIDLLDWFQTIWDGKWKILSIMAVSLLSVFGFNTFVPNTTFNAQTEIKPITSFELDKYRVFNASLQKFDQYAQTVIKPITSFQLDKYSLFNPSLQKFDQYTGKVDIFNISDKSLLTLYIEQIEEGTLLETGIDKFELINKDEFKNKNDYREAIQKFASEIKVLRPINVDRKAKGAVRLYHVLTAEYNDQNKWKKLLSFVDSEANKKVKQIINNRFQSIISVKEQLKTFAINDIDIQLENDIEDYERIIKERLAFLSEQATIARKLGVKSMTIEAQTIGTQNTIVTKLNNDLPFYLRGYVAIEEEIKLIKERKDKTLFISSLNKLQKAKRKLLQDKTLDRAKLLFKETPLNENNFKSTLFKVAATDFILNNKRSLYYTIALVLGGVIGVVFVLVSKALKNRKTMQTQS